MKYFLRSEQNHQRRLPLSERQTEKGQKHEAFDYGRILCGQRDVALALRMDRKR